MTISFPAVNEPINTIRKKRPTMMPSVLTERLLSHRSRLTHPVPPAREAKSAFRETTARKAAKPASPAPHGLRRVMSALRLAMIRLIGLPVPFAMTTVRKTEREPRELPALREETVLPARLAMTVQAARLMVTGPLAKGIREKRQSPLVATVLHVPRVMTVLHVLIVRPEVIAQAAHHTLVVRPEVTALPVKGIREKHQLLLVANALRVTTARRAPNALLTLIDPRELCDLTALPAKDIRGKRQQLPAATARLTVAALRESRAPIAVPVLLAHLSSPLKLLPNLFRFLERFRKR